MLYPIVSDFVNSRNQTQVITNYVQDVENTPEETYEKELNDAKKYNEFISHYSTLNDALYAQKNYTGTQYEELLDISGMGVMGILEIPSQDIQLPIYHGTGEAELQVGVGHYIGSSLPVGGKSTHCVLTGHTGLPSSRLLTDIDQLEEGDIFYITVLKETIAYEVDQIKVVLPEELDDINIVEGEDYCTLVTCTPYGVNSHRLLVRGKRIAYVDLSNELNDEVWCLPSWLGILIVVLMYVLVVVIKNKRRKKG